VKRSMPQINLSMVRKMEDLIYRARYPFMLLVTLLLVLTSACQGLGVEEPRVYASQIEIEYPDGMTVANGGAIAITVINRSIYCVQFPVSGPIPVYVYVGSTSIQVPNSMTYAWPAIKMSPLNTVSASRKIEVAPYLDPDDDTFDMPVYSAYIPLEGFICDTPTATLSKKIPFFIQFYMDY
jgi:hypothetical protein